jgi:hypothetical protein
MKPIALTAVLLLLFSMHSFGEFSLGVNLHVGTDIELQDGADEASNTQSYFIQPVFIFMLSDIFELAPYAGFNITTDKSAGADEADIYPGFNLGVGFLFRVISGDVFRLSLGPQPFFRMNFDNNNNREMKHLYTGLDVPVNIDLRFTERFFFRSGISILNVTYYRRSPGFSRTSTDLVSYGSLSGGFFFTF